MLFVRTDDLRPGMRLAKPVYNKMGVMLYERDTKLNSQGIESIRNFELIGIYILEPAEPAPPLSDEDIAFEQFQTIAMFQLRDCMRKIGNGRKPDTLLTLARSIITQYGSLDHKLNFTQNLRSPADYVYKHSISAAILVAMLSHILGLPNEFQESCVIAALLYDYGSLLIPPDISEKTEPLTPSDKQVIRTCRKKGYEMLTPEDRSITLSKDVLKTISQVIYLTNSDSEDASEKITRTNGSKLLLIADCFDRMTAMSLTSEPVSEVVALKYLQEFPDIYEPKMVHALSLCIHILPRGACVDLSNGQKGLILEDNPEDYSRPLVLQFSDNTIYNLRDSSTYDLIQIQDIMKTMDNRHVVDTSLLEKYTGQTLHMGSSIKK